MKSFATGRYHGNVFYDHMIAHPFGQMAVVMDMIAGGVLDRFPCASASLKAVGLDSVLARPPRRTLRSGPSRRG
jgi:hypothetical protein